MKIAIPSHKRSEQFKQKTYGLLQKHNFDSKDIFIFVSPESHEEYSGIFTDCNVILSKNNILDTRNHIIDFFDEGEKIVELDDDIAAESILKPAIVPAVFAIILLAVISPIIFAADAVISPEAFTLKLDDDIKNSFPVADPLIKKPAPRNALSSTSKLPIDADTNLAYPCEVICDR